MRSLPTMPLASLLLLAALFSASHGQPAAPNGPDSGNLQHNPTSETCQEYLGKDLHEVYRRIDGSCNSIHYPGWGSTSRGQTRYIPMKETVMTGEKKPEPRIVSNVIFEEGGDGGSPLSKAKLSEATIFFGQFVDHNLAATGSNKEETLEMRVPEDDKHFLRNNVTVSMLPFERSKRVQDEDNGWTPINSLASYLDLSAVYGADNLRANVLRSHKGGKMNASPGNMLQFNDQGLRNAPANTKNFFLAGDHRVNEHSVLAAIHTTFRRGHNVFCDALAEKYPSWDDQRLYQEARKINIAFFQAIVFEEYLPAILGDESPEAYRGYGPHVRTDLSVIFTTAAFRLGHSQVKNSITRFDEKRTAMGALPMSEMFFQAPKHIAKDGIEPYLMGMCLNVANEVDTSVAGSIRSFLFSNVKGESALDLMANNILRGRDHGLPTFNEVRELHGLPRIRSWKQLTGDRHLIRKLKALYGNNVDNVDLWVALAAEKHPGGDCQIGHTAAKVWKSAFESLRAGDSQWYQREGLFSEKMMDFEYVQMIYSRAARGGERSIYKKYMSFTTKMALADLPRRPFFAIY